MKRTHIHLSVTDLDDSIAFYTALFGAEPDKQKQDYARWRLADPAINLAISKRRCGDPGINHLGLEMENDEDLEAVRNRLEGVDQQTKDQSATQCCYAVSNKAWAEDPTGIRWENFHTLGDADAENFLEASPRA